MSIQDQLKKIPSVDRVLHEPAVKDILKSHPRTLVVESIRQIVTQIREDIRKGKKPAYGISLADITQAAQSILEKKEALSLGPAVNATGVILHTGLGRAVLPEAAQKAVSDVAKGHSTLEIDRQTGQRGSRTKAVEKLLTDLTGAEAASFVNNNAAAVFLAINTLAAGREVIISRGQLVEIGGSFRVPDIIRRAGCRIVEVGTTNRTRISDYEEAITEDTALILRIHQSNFKIVGFSEEASLEDLISLGKSRGIPVMDDLGSGALIHMDRFGLADEPLSQDSVKAGCDLVAFSGDKLLGGPQAGILVGKKGAIELCKKNPIARVVRMDKLSLAALEATLKLYSDVNYALEKIPTLHAIARPLDDIKAQAKRLASRLRRASDGQLEIDVEKSFSQVGGGSVPGQDIPSWAVTLRSSSISADDLSRHFRLNTVPIFGRIENDRLLLDVRTVSQGEEAIIVECIRRLIGR